jgi:uncharacterized membrane protein YeaQ/YmgE (transglycosylase-associated protein family)
LSGVIGWPASLTINTDDRPGVARDLVDGIVGDLLAGRFISPRVGIGTINQNDFCLPDLEGSFIDSVILLAIVNLLRLGMAG